MTVTAGPAASRDYVETFLAEDAPLGAARARAAEFGCTPIGPGGVVALNDTLWHDRVADPSARDQETVAIRDLNRAVRDDDRLVPVLLPVSDGLLAAVYRP